MKKYYTCFLFNGERDPRVLHCTHKYLGKQSPESIGEIQEYLYDYFVRRTISIDHTQWTPRRLPRIVFKDVDIYGANQRVLKASNIEEARAHLMPSLRDWLDRYQTDDYDYNPHVTTELPIVDRAIVSYALVEDGTIIAEWPINGT